MIVKGRGLCPVVLRIESVVLVQECCTVGGMDSIVSPPVWQSTFKFFGWIQLHGVVISTADPFSHAVVVIPLESRDMLSPHLGGRVVLPSIAGHGERLDYLEGFYTLLAQSPIVEALNCLRYDWTRYERLHLFAPLSKKCKKRLRVLLLHAA